MSALPLPRLQYAMAADPAARPILRVLLADDSHDVTLWMKVLLTHAGYDVRTVNSGREALEVGGKWRPGAFLLDIRMPGMDGLEVARQIRAQEWGKTVTLIAITGRAEPEDVERSRSAGFDHHLLKPVTADMLLKVLAKVVTPS